MQGSKAGFIFGIVLLYVVSSALLIINNGLMSHRKNATQCSRYNWRAPEKGSATQGALWVPNKVRSYSGRKGLFLEEKKKIPVKPLCQNWMVLTTIFPPTKVFHQFKSLDHWCTVIVGDAKTNTGQWQREVVNKSNTFFLSVEDQNKLDYNIMNYISINHFGRKSIGYLFAIQHGATKIWDTDDDNELFGPYVLQEFSNVSRDIPSWTQNGFLVNPYPWFQPISQDGEKQRITWPRGYPLQLVKNEILSKPSFSETVNFSSIALFQSLADLNPDIDAVYRMTKSIPKRFERKGAIVALKNSQIAPFNAQATLWLQSAFWGLLLPVTVHGRVSDIWRSYIMQTVLRFTKFSVAFTSSKVIQHRNPHSLMADFESEIDLYLQSEEFTRWLEYYEPPKLPKIDVPTILEDIVIKLYEIEVLQKSDIELVQAWIRDLKRLQYTFPILTQIQNQKKNSKSRKQ